jgi:hypothetical protein
MTSEQQGRTSGRRTVLHQYPKRDYTKTWVRAFIAMRVLDPAPLIRMIPNKEATDASSARMPRDYNVARDNLEKH